MTRYPTIKNCNYESRNDSRGSAIQAARRAADQGKVDVNVTNALDELESTLEDFSEESHVAAVEACREAEDSVVEAWLAYVRQVGEKIGLAIARDVIADDMPHEWDGLDGQDGDQAVAAGIHFGPDWEAMESAAKTAYLQAIADRDGSL
jgi:hypothetical protein